MLQCSHMILNIYKEKDWTSHDVVAKVKNLLNTYEKLPPKIARKRKVGHAGTLDPLAEGVLIVLTDHDTRRQQEFIGYPKEYECEIAFGAKSDTYDLEGDLTYSAMPENFDLPRLLTPLLDKYRGEFSQTVPPYSAVKIRGKKLYEESRRGKIDKLTLPVKKVNIYQLDVLGFDQYENLPTVKLKMLCSKGTYVRSLAHDLGEEMGVGGVLVFLVRTKVGNYSTRTAVKISELEAKLKA